MNDYDHLRGHHHRCAARTVALATLTALTLFAAACGNDDGATEASATTSPSAQGTDRTPQRAPLRVGVLVNVTGQLLIGEQHAPPVLEAWAAHTNDQGGVAGHPVELVIEDTKGDASTASSIVDEWASTGDIAAIVMFDVVTESVIADAITEAGIPVIGGNGAAPTAWGALPNWFPVNTTFPSLINVGWVMAERLGAASTAYVVCAENPVCAAAEPIASAAADGLGLSYLGTLKVAASAPDYTAECLQLIDDHVEYVMLGLTGSQPNLRFVDACVTQGYDGLWGFFGALAEPDLMIDNDPGVPIHLGFSSFPWFTDDEPVQVYRKVMEQKDVAEEHWAGPIGPSAWATMELFRKALGDYGDRLASEPGAADVIAAYGEVENETLDGLIPQPVTFTAGEPSPPISCYWVGEFSGGQFSGADLDEPVCDPAVLSGS